MELSKEARHVKRKVKNMTKRLDDEEMIKEDVNQKLRRQNSEEYHWLENQEKCLRAEKNKERREEAEWKETEESLISELVCPICEEEMCPPKQIYQCDQGHVLCHHCVGRDGPKVNMQDGNNISYVFVFLKMTKYQVNLMLPFVLRCVYMDVEE